MTPAPENPSPMAGLALPPLDLSSVMGQVGPAEVPPPQAQGLMPSPMGQPMGAPAPAPQPNGAPELPFENVTQPDGSIVTKLKGSQPELILAVTPPPPRVKQFLSGKI